MGLPGRWVDLDPRCGSNGGGRRVRRPDLLRRGHLVDALGDQVTEPIDLGFLADTRDTAAGWLWVHGEGAHDATGSSEIR